LVTKGIRAFGELAVNRQEGEGYHGGRCDDRVRADARVFIRDPQFQSQTKDRLTSPEASGLSKARCAIISTISSPTIWSAARRCWPM
jgi:topoisomerase-4 subunit B